MEQAPKKSATFGDEFVVANDAFETAGDYDWCGEGTRYRFETAIDPLTDRDWLPSEPLLQWLARVLDMWLSGLMQRLEELL